MFIGDNTNVLPSPLDIFSWTSGGFAFNCTMSRDPTTGLSPAGGMPFKMAVTANDPFVGTYQAEKWNLATCAQGQTWRATAYVKASVATQAGFFIFGANTSGTLTETTSNVLSVTTSWTQISFTYTFLLSGSVRIQTRLDGPDTGGAGINLWWDQYLLYRVS